MTAIEIIEFSNVHPELTYNGIEWNQKSERYTDDRTCLIKNTDEIIKCLDWLSNFYLPSRLKRKGTNSYSVKHLVEDHYKTYISNGAFVTAFLIKGYSSARLKDNPNVYFKFDNKLVLQHKERLARPYRMCQNH